MGNVTTAMFIVYHVFFGVTFASTPWIYSAEVNSLGWRARGAAAATATNWVCNTKILSLLLHLKGCFTP